MTHLTQHRTAESYADHNVATSDDDLIAWVAEYGPMAQACKCVGGSETSTCTW